MNQSVSNDAPDPSDDREGDPSEDGSLSVSRRKWPRRLAIGVFAVIVLPIGALLVYREFFVPEAAAPLVLGERAAPDSVAGATSTVPEAVPAAVLQSSSWVTGDDSIVGYRVDEVVAGVLDETVAGRTSGVDGSVEIVDGRVTEADFVVDMTTLDSGSSARDSALRRSELNTDDFPDSTFVLAEPIDLDLDDPSVVVERDVGGALTLRGETRAVDVTVEARIVGGELQILGTMPIDFDEFDIPLDPPGVSLENTQVEFSLILRTAAQDL